MYAGRKLQPVSIGATTDLLNGPDRSRGGRRIEGHGARRMGGGTLDEKTLVPGALWEAHRQN